MRIAFLSTIIPNTLTTGSEIASRAVLSVLVALGHEVTLYAYGRSPFRVDAPVASVLLATIPIETAATPMSEKIVWAWRSLRSGRPISSEKYNYISPKILQEEVLKSKPDLLIVEHVNLYPFVSELASQMPFGVIFQDIQAVSYAMVSKGARRPWWRAIYAREARLNAHLERLVGREARFCWFLSEADAECARADLGIANGEVLPVFFPLDASKAPEPSASPAYDVALIGTWSWPPVQQGMTWFIDSVVPLLPQDISIAVAGSGSLTLPSTRLLKLGVVPDAREFLAASRVSAVPTVAGTGIQVKTLELAATGTPAVSTPLGVRGIDQLPHNLQVARSAESFARLIVEAVHNPRPHDAEVGRAWNEERRRAAVTAVAAGLAQL